MFRKGFFLIAAFIFTQGNAVELLINEHLIIAQNEGPSQEIVAKESCKEPEENGAPCKRSSARKPCASSCSARSGCTPPPPCCWQFNPCNPRKCTNMCGDGFSVLTEFLYLRSENSGFSVAYQQNVSNPAGLNVGDVVRIDPDWTPAFRAGISWNVDYDFWDLALKYTWYRNHSTLNETSALGFFPLWPVSSATTAEFATIEGSSLFKMNLGNFELARLTYLTKKVAIRPYLGVEGGTLHQHFKALLKTALTGNTAENRSFLKNLYWGVGPSIGMNLAFDLRGGFSVVGQVMGSLLYGKTKARLLNQTKANGSNQFVVARDHEEDFYQLSSHALFSLGLQWQTCFRCEKNRFKASVSWESHYFANQFNVPVSMQGFLAPLPSQSGEVLSLEGAQIALGFDF